ncbi:MAG TPA: HAMP domain-containing protein [Phycisphaerae bacterium]|jgi:two-component system heavy metal sensor histidine kinase CusS|nr:HAMP domain-containing protein [Phycisphaerae bacterium]
MLGLAAPPPINGPRRGPPPAETPIIQQHGEFREALLRGPFDTRLAVGKSVAPEEASLRHAAILLLCVGAAVMLLGLARGFALSRRVVRPIRRMTAVAGDISATNLSRRMEPAEVPGELKELAGVLNDMFALG